MAEDSPEVLAEAADAIDPTRADEIRLRYAAIVESSNDAIIAKTLDGVISGWNAAAERMFGYTENEAIGQPITLIIPPELHEEEHEIRRRLRAGERLDHFETVRVTKAGESIDVSLTISPLRDPAGQIIGCSKTARDITQSKQAATALRQSEQRLRREVARATTLQSISARLISESTPETLYDHIIGAAMELMGSDAACVQMLAADNTSLTLLAWTNFHPDCVPFWQRVAAGAGSACSKALSDNQRVVVTDIETCDFMAGTQEQLEYRRAGVRGVQSTPLRSRTGQLLGMLSTHWRAPHTPTEDDFRFFDVLARLAADLIERTLAVEALRESEQRFRLIANAAPVMIWMSDTDKEITYVNQTWLDYSGRSSDTAVEKLQATVLHPDEAERCRDVYERAFEQRDRFQMEHRLRRHDNEYRWVVTVGVPRYHADGSFAGYIGTSIDITERKLAEATIASQKLIEAHEEERTRIARELHDDISQQLALLGMNLEIVKQRLPASATDLRTEVREMDRQITALATDIQALSHGLHSPKLELLGLKAAVAGLCEELSNRHDVTIDVQFENIPPALPPEIALCVYRVLQEALQNIVKHGEPRRGHVVLSGHIDTISLTVTDSGPGFDPHEAVRGPGLGLTSMDERLKVVGGQLSIQSQRGQGTRIHALAPLRLSSGSTERFV
jgi:PAS domain S-box-containing protein